jgi:hypothetical protein
MGPSSCPDNCYAKVVEAVATTQYEATQGKLDSIISNQGELIKGVNAVVMVIERVTNLSARLDRHEDDSKKTFDQVFDLIRLKADRSDLVTIQSKGVNWLWDIVKLLAVGIIGWLAGRG